MKIILDQNTMERTIRRISYEIIEKNRDLSNIIVFGIKSRGIILGKRIVANIEAIEGVKLPFEPLNVRPFRDDLKEPLPKELPSIDISGKTVILIDDVLYTGRTIRAALDAIIEIGRPALIQLAILIDRGHRELPIAANYVGKNIPTSRSEKVQVNFMETDGIEQVVLS
jgi:pyrimidine operon attenuation protein/uracil phosphoribosyltransferase